MIKIQDVIVPTKGTAKYFNIIALNFPMNPTSVTFYWQIFSETQNEEQEPIPGSSLMDGNIVMTAWSTKRSSFIIGLKKSKKSG